MSEARADPVEAGIPGLDRVPPTVLVLVAVGAVQLGAAVAKGLFDEVGPGGAVLLRILLSAVIVNALTRPRLRHRTGRDLGLAAVYGLVLAGMNLCFYEALSRVPLGVGVTLEFVGPLAVAVVGSRRPRHLLWAALAAVGILLLGLGEGGGGSAVDRTGAALAVLAGTLWAGYIVLSARVGRRFPAGDALAVGLAAGTLLVLPFGLAQGGTGLLRPWVLAGGLVVALLSSAVPYSLELEALRRLPKRVFGVLMSLEPAVAALVGLLVLGQALSAAQWAAVVLVVVASVGATRSGGPAPRDA